MAESLIDCFFPPHCLNCGRPSGGSQERILCSGCLGVLERTRIMSPRCAVCGRPFAANKEDSAPDTCLSCRITAPHFARARSLFPYRGPAGAVVKAFKFADQYYLGAELLKAAIRAGWFPAHTDDCEAVVPVPLHRRRRFRRGYNQAELLARVVAHHIARPCMPCQLKRIKHTRSQTRLAVRQRMENVRGAFRASRKNMPERILLVDDVYTTGATANECARELKRAGCGQIIVLTLVRATV